MEPLSNQQRWSHPSLNRRMMLQAGAVGMLGLGMSELESLRALAGNSSSAKRGKSVIYIYAIGGMSQHETFDMKPDAPADIRGEFHPISTSTPGTHICEHLPQLARRSQLYSIVRTITHPEVSHLAGCMVMQSGRTKLPDSFKGPANRSDWPGIAATAGHAIGDTGALPPAMLLPELTWHNRVNLVPGQTAGMMGAQHDPWVVQATARCLGNGYNTRGACPDCFEFITYDPNHPHKHEASPLFEPPRLELPADISDGRLGDRLDLLTEIDRQRKGLEQAAAVADLGRNRQRALSLLADPATRDAFDVRKCDPAVIDRYGHNKFGLSMLLARRLVEVGVRMVQVNLGHNFTWDTHSAQFPELKDRLLPPTDKALSALLDDLESSGMLDDVLVVLASEFGRTPKVFRYEGDPSGLAGRGHWGPLQSVLFAGGGVQGGRVIGKSDKEGGYPLSDAHTPEDFAATIYQVLGIPRNATWYDDQARPHHVYHGNPISQLM